MRTRSQRGSMLLLSLAVIVIVAGMVTTLLMVATSGSRRERGRDYKFKSREIAEAGVDLSLINLRQVTNNEDDDGDGTVDEGLGAYDYLTPYGHFAAGDVANLEGNLGRIGTVNWTLADDANLNGWPDFGENNVNPIAFSNGEIFAFTLFSELDGLDNDGDGTTDEQDEAGSLTAIAFGRFPAVPAGSNPNGREIVSMAMYNGIFTDEHGPPNPPNWLPDAAIAADSELIVHGNPDVLGSKGSIHSNDKIDIGGNAAYIHMDATGVNGVTGTISAVHGADNGGIGVGVGQQYAADMPDMRPEMLKPQATHIFGSDGAVYNQQNQQLSPPGSNYHGWSYDSVTGTWGLSGGNQDFTGVAYIDGNAKLSGAGNAGPQTLSIIATGNIKVTGNGTYNTALPGQSEWLFLAGGDIWLNGAQNSGPDLEGLIVAREQVVQNGGGNIHGAVIACDADNRFDMATQNKIGGHATITFNGNVDSQIPIYVPTNRYVLDPQFAAYEER